MNAAIDFFVYSVCYCVFVSFSILLPYIYIYISFDYCNVFVCASIAIIDFVFIGAIYFPSNKLVFPLQHFSWIFFKHAYVHATCRPDRQFNFPFAHLEVPNGHLSWKICFICV